jgi:hypothetical protein
MSWLTSAAVSICSCEPSNELPRHDEDDDEDDDRLLLAGQSTKVGPVAALLFSPRTFVRLALFLSHARARPGSAGYRFNSA